jgi:ribonuclease J
LRGSIGVPDDRAVRIIPLGGVGEIGLNMTVIEAGDDLLVVDAGLMFPEEGMPGIDLVVPDMTYLFERRERVRAVLLTHGHEDHTGALPYLLDGLKVPVYGTPLSLGLAAEKLRECDLVAEADLRPVRARDRVRLGAFEVEFLRVSHSIPDGVALAIATPAGTIVHTGDFKFDQSPVDGQLTDYRRLSELGDAGVLVLLSDSTNAGRDGFTPSERTVGRAFEEIIRSAPGCVIVACFASNLHRIQQVLDVAASLGKQVAVSGKSMVANTRIGTELGYLRVPQGTLIGPEELQRLPPSRGVLLTTGSQGEPLSAIARIASAEHRQIRVAPGDTVVFSARVIPGNEKSIARTINDLYRQGARVVTEEVAGVHVSGHASREELKLMLNLTRPTYLVPIHGEPRHLHLHAELAREVGVPPAHTFVVENGDILEFTCGHGRIAGRAPAGRVYVDGKGIGDVGDAVLKDRQRLAQDGVVVVAIGMDRYLGKVVAGPEILSRGFAGGQPPDTRLDDVKALVLSVLDATTDEERRDRGLLEQRVRSTLRRHFQRGMERRPMILPVIIEV